MSKKTFIIAVVIVLAIIGGLSTRYLFLKNSENQNGSASAQCQIKEMTFYYLDGCGWCQKVKDEGTLSKLEQLGVKINQVNAAVGPIRHEFTGVPTFVINEKVYSGYKTFDELKELLGCRVDSASGNNQPVSNDQESANSPAPATSESPSTETASENQQNINSEAPATGETSSAEVVSEKDFYGPKGDKVIIENNEVKIAAALFTDSAAKFFNVSMSDNKTVYFFVLKDQDGIYRAAANACQVCFGERKGFRQEGEEIVCNNCGNRYPIKKIATEKGGCNPGPINPNIEVQAGQLIIQQSDIEKVTELF